MKLFTVLASIALLIACGAVIRDNRSGPNQPNPVAPPVASEVVVIGTASFNVTTGQGLSLASTYPVVVTLAPNTQFAINTAGFVIPVMSNAVLDFGNITVSQASTNKLKLCGPGGNQKCGRALLRVYTTVAAGPGFWNVDGYGAPMSAGLAGSLATIDLGQASAVTVESFTIPAGRNTLKLSDFSPAPVFLFQGDFSDAGEGTYSTTITIELALAP